MGLFPRGLKSPLIALPVAWLMLGVGCDGEEPIHSLTSYTTGYTATTSSSTTTTSSRVVTTASTDCDQTHPHGLTLSTDRTDEVEYLKDFVACTNASESSTLLRNNGSEVWTISTSGTVSPGTASYRSASFSSLTKSLSSQPLLVPGSSVVVSASPSDVTWQIADGFSAAWLVHDELGDQFESWGQEKAVELFTGASTHSRALGKCTLAAFGAWKAITDFPNDPGKQLIEGAGMASDASGCAKEWRAADDVATAKAGRGSTPTWSDDIALIAKNDEFLAKVTRKASFWNRNLRQLVRAAFR